MSNEQTHQGCEDGVENDQHLMRQKNDFEQGAQSRQPHRARDDCGVLIGKTLPDFDNKVADYPHQIRGKRNGHPQQACPRQ